MKYYIHVLKNYSVFQGRASRMEFWMFILFNSIFASVAMLLDNMLGTTIPMMGTPTLRYGIYGYIYLLYCLVALIPSIAVSVRRLHDINKSGWYYCLWFVLCIGWVWLIVLFCTPGTTGANQYGRDPLGDAGTA